MTTRDAVTESELDSFLEWAKDRLPTWTPFLSLGKRVVVFARYAGTESVEVKNAHGTGKAFGRDNLFKILKKYREIKAKEGGKLRTCDFTIPAWDPLPSGLDMIFPPYVAALIRAYYEERSAPEASRDDEQLDAKLAELGFPKTVGGDTSDLAATSPVVARKMHWTLPDEKGGQMSAMKEELASLKEELRKRDEILAQRDAQINKLIDIISRTR